MNARGFILFAAAASLAIAFVLTGCGDDVYTGESPPNMPPEITLSSGPVENSTTGYRVHFYWNAWDPDGEVSHFEYVMVDGDPIGFSSADTTGLAKWSSTSVFDSIFKVSADQYVEPYKLNPLYEVYDRTHIFFVRAVDTEGMRSEVASRSFTAWTLSPVVEIDRPEGRGRTYSTVVTFGWKTWDPIDNTSNVQDPAFVRYLYSTVVDHDNVYDPRFNFIKDLNENPQHYEHLWSKWIPYETYTGSGTEVILGDDEILELNRSYVFAVQARDEAGAVTSLMRKDHNARQFVVSFKAGPLLMVSEQHIGGSQFLGTQMLTVNTQLPPGIPLKFHWEADASSYGGEISGYRYGWDVQDLNDPNQWETAFRPDVTTARERTLYSGIHTFFVEAKDNGGKITRAMVEVEVVPFTMERDLLVVDDASYGDGIDPLRMIPSEQEHDEFWIDIASKAGRFEAERDVYDCRDTNFQPPKMDLIGKYKNVIWLSSNSQHSTTLGQVIGFIPESMITLSSRLAVNYLSIFLEKGGHLWMEGRADRAYGGLSVVFPNAPMFPAAFKYDMAEAMIDTSGVFSMPYRDLCVSVVDKIVGNFRVESDMPPRTVKNDGLKYIYKDTGDAFAVRLASMPERIDLWEEVTCPDCFFNPDNNLFTFVEIYNPEYWMEEKMIRPLACFQPLYRMRAGEWISPVDYATVAFIATKYSGKVPHVGDGVAVAANSYFFGLPLWYFDHDSIEEIADAIFTEWRIVAK